MGNFAVSCHTCRHVVYSGDEPPDDGQPPLTEYADSTPGQCPSKVVDCPHRTAAIDSRKRRQPATLADLDDLKGRIGELEKGGRRV